MIIRKMDAADIREVHNIEESIFSIPWSEKSLQDAALTEENIYLVCEQEGKILGYCGMWTVLGEGNITNVAVRQEARRQGVAQKLFEKLHEEGRKKNVDIYFLEVRESNIAARNLYKKMGYKDIGRRKNFYEKPVEDAIVMSKIYNEDQIRC